MSVGNVGLPNTGTASPMYLITLAVAGALALAGLYRRLRSE